MSTLMYDYEVVSRINDLVGSLKGNYRDLSTDVTKRILATIQSSIQKKDEEMAWVDSCCLQLIARTKNGKEETFTFQTEDPSVKKEWITELRLAQLSLDPNNSPAWEIPEREHRPPSTKLPLFVKAQCVHKSHHQTEVNTIFRKILIFLKFFGQNILTVYFLHRSDVAAITQQRITIEHRHVVVRRIKITLGYVQRMERVAI